MPKRTNSEIEAENQFLWAELEAIADRLDDVLESSDVNAHKDEEFDNDQDDDQ